MCCYHLIQYHFIPIVQFLQALYNSFCPKVKFLAAHSTAVHALKIIGAGQTVISLKQYATARIAGIAALSLRCQRNGIHWPLEILLYEYMMTSLDAFGACLPTAEYIKVSSSEVSMLHTALSPHIGMQLSYFNPSAFQNGAYFTYISRYLQYHEPISFITDLDSNIYDPENIFKQNDDNNSDRRLVHLSKNARNCSPQRNLHSAFFSKP